MSDRSNLSAFAQSEQSQHGEDGMLVEVFRRLGVEQGYFVEFGASDGVRNSNTRSLWKQGWSGCYIEGDAERFAQLERNISMERAALVNAYVDTSGPHSLDAILDDVGAPDVIDALSIDVDGDDLELWRAMTGRCARCVVIEYNPTIPLGVHYENPAGASHGNSGTAICALAEQRDLVLVAQTRVNLVFLAREDAIAASLDPVPLVSSVSYFFGYDSSLIRALDGQASIDELYKGPWGGYIVQPFPRWMRRFGKHDTAKTIHAAMTALLTAPSQLVRLLRDRRQFTRW